MYPVSNSQQLMYFSCNVSFSSLPVFLPVRQSSSLVLVLETLCLCSIDHSPGYGLHCGKRTRLDCSAILYLVSCHYRLDLHCGPDAATRIHADILVLCRGYWLYPFGHMRIGWGTLFWCLSRSVWNLSLYRKHLAVGS